MYVTQSSSTDGPAAIRLRRRCITRRSCAAGTGAASPDGDDPGRDWPAHRGVWLPGKPAEQSADELVPAVERGEHWWPVALAILVAAGLHAALPAEYRIQPGWAEPAVLLALLCVLIAGDPGRIDRQKPWLRLVLGSTIAFITVATMLAAVRLVADILTNNKLFADHPGGLLAAGGVIWVTNIIAFGLWYWDLDRGGAAARAHHPNRNPAFVFPEMLHTTTCPPPGCRSSWTTSRCPSGPPPQSVLPTSRRSSRGPSS